MRGARASAAGRLAAHRRRPARAARLLVARQRARGRAARALLLRRRRAVVRAALPRRRSTCARCVRAIRPGARSRAAASRGATRSMRSRALLPAPPPAGAPLPVPFAGGALVALGYELGAALEPVAVSACDDLALPDLDRLRRGPALRLRPRRGPRLRAGARREDADAAAAARRAEAARACARGARSPTARRRPAPARAARALAAAGRLRRRAATPRRWSGSARASRRAISTRRASRIASRLPFAGDAFALAGALRARNPAPFACLLALPDATVVGSSPERFLRVTPTAGWRAARSRARGRAARTPRADRARARGARRLREGPRREPDDRGPGAQRPRPRLRDRQRPRARAVRDRALRERVPARLDGARPARARTATRSTPCAPPSRPAR